MAISHKGKRQLKVNDKVYLWYVKENEDWYGLILTVFLDDHIFLRRESRIFEKDTCTLSSTFPVTPATVRQEILREIEDNKKREILSRLPDVKAPGGWELVAELSECATYGVGFDREEDFLLTASCPQDESNLRCMELILYDLKAGEEIAHELADPGTELDTNKGFCEGIGPLKGRKIPFSSWGKSSLPLINSWGEALYQPAFESKDIYFQPPGQECTNPENNEGCVRLLQGTYAHRRLGFSASGCYFVIVRDRIPTVWKKRMS